eukprot:TRINITY_DN1469_c0_g1_i1.p1 TRINITY_DN1469_c0_g1~~TRINITY_DN1469_c0_g1_i1.p1  ORF type:complete len:357 (+),score=38.41 TRINITY_DN1469_c0_g1_i1:256-1326(+)
MTTGASVQFLNLLTGSAYGIAISPTPTTLKTWFADPEGCVGSIILEFLPPSASQHWTANGGGTWRPCAGSTIDGSKIIQTATICSSSSPIFQVVMGPYASSSVSIYAAAGATSCNTLYCGIVPATSLWAYNDFSNNLVSPTWATRAAGTTGWKTGLPLFGFGSTDVATKIAQGGSGNAGTWYFKSSFSYNPMSCVKQLQMGVIVNDGVVVYINGKEVFRSNLPSGTVRPSTAAFGDGQTYLTPAFTVTTINTANANLVSGTNVIAVEVHAHAIYAWNIRFNLWLLATGTGCNANSFYNWGSKAPTPSGGSTPSPAPKGGHHTKGGHHPPKNVTKKKSPPGKGHHKGGGGGHHKARR